MRRNCRYRYPFYLCTDGTERIVWKGAGLRMNVVSFLQTSNGRQTDANGRLLRMQMDYRTTNPWMKDKISGPRGFQHASNTCAARLRMASGWKGRRWQVHTVVQFVTRCQKEEKRRRRWKTTTTTIETRRFVDCHSNRLSNYSPAPLETCSACTRRKARCPVARIHYRCNAAVTDKFIANINLSRYANRSVFNAVEIKAPKGKRRLAFFYRFIVTE